MENGRQFGNLEERGIASCWEVRRLILWPDGGILVLICEASALTHYSSQTTR